MSSRQLDEEAILQVARKIHDQDTRSQYLDQVCAGDWALHERVEALLEVHEQEQSFLKSKNVEPDDTVEGTPLGERPGTTIGRYKLMEQIGEGGMGVVFVAEQERPIRRKVAVKIIKPGMDSKSVVARFEAERQALAMMDHPSIARVLDAGTSGTGRPYFAMELVKGIPITEYCDTNKLTIPERLELFVQVCQAIQHAHQKGIVHRDIKPSNVLVTLHDGKPVPKVIDFGVAKALNARLTDKTIYTEHLQIVGTLLYMSPEQAEFSGLDIDTRSDIYSLGVLLYELLTGTTPFRQDDLNKAGFDEQRRIIREQEPPRASVRISSLAETATTIAEQRKTDTKKLNQLVRGDLDWIVLKSLEKDRTRRYETAIGFAADIERFLGDEPVTACPPRPGYRLRKFARRNRPLVIAVLGIMVTLTMGLLGTGWGLAWAIYEKGQVEVLAKREAKYADKYREHLFHNALMATLTGDESAERMISEARDAGISPQRIQLLEIRLLINHGRFQAAITEMEQAVEESGRGVALRASLAAAYALNGYSEKHREQMHHLKQLEPSSPEDYLCLAHATIFSNPAQAIPLAKKAMELHDSYMAHVILGEAYSQDAVETDDTESARQAIVELQAAKTFMPKSPFVLGAYLFSNLVSARLADKQQKPNEAFLRNALQAVQEFEKHPKYAMGRHLCGLYYDYVEDNDSARQELSAAVDQGATGVLAITYAAFLFREGDSEAAFKVLESLGENRIARVTLAQFLALDAATRQRAEQVIARLEPIDEPSNTLSTAKMAITTPEVVYLLCGKREQAMKQAQTRLASGAFCGKWEKLRLEIILNRAGPDDLLKASEGSNYQTAISHKFIGQVLLAQGKEEEALCHLHKARQACWFWPDAFVADAIREHVISKQHVGSVRAAESRDGAID